MAKPKGKNKGKKNNPFGGRKGKKKNNPYGGKKGSLKVNPANYQTKAQKQSFISQITADGKINQQEATNAATLGISPERIQKGYDRSFYPGNPFTPTPTIIGGRGSSQIGGQVQQRPYMPLIIGNKASAALGQSTASVPQNPVQDSGNTAPINNDPVVVEEEEEFYDPFADFMAMFPSMLEALKPEPYEPLPPPTTYASIGQAAQSAPGVKARRSSASQSLQSSLGTRGSFNRGGLRISNLNI